MRIGIYGGCFNPPHKMHERIAEDLIEKGYLDKVIFVPTGDYYFKRNLENSMKRIEMLKLICKDNGKLEVSNYEVEKYRHTYQTLQHFQNRYPNDEIYFITGSDNFKSIDTWENYIVILENFGLIVVQRNEDDLQELGEIYCGDENNIVFVELENTEVASSMIREEIFGNGVQREKLREYVSSEVIDYIAENDLYVDKFGRPKSL